MRAYIKTVTYAVQFGFIFAGAIFLSILLPELIRVNGDSNLSEFNDKLLVGVFALAVCIAGVTGAAFVRRFLLKRY